MTPPALIPENLLLSGVSVVAWPDGMMKTSRCSGTATKVPDTEKDNGFKLVLKLSDGREFIDPEFPWLAN